MMINQRNLWSQIIVLSILIAVASYFFINAAKNLTDRGIASGFDFLNNNTGFDLIMSLISYSASSSYLRLFVVGILNTLLLSGLCIIFATIIGIIMGSGRLSSNWLIAKISTVYIEVFRNIPLLLQIFFWYYIILQKLPSEKDSITLFNFLSLNIKGLNLFNNQMVIIPELIAMLIGISLYAACYIAENIRSGILSVDNGQTEAARALGLHRKRIFRLIILPQALRVIIPPLTSQYLNIIKNTSLSAAIGYPDLVAVFAGTALSQTGQAIETIFMTMLVYLAISLCISIFMNWYNHKVLIGYKR